MATTGGITAENVQDLMVATVEHRYGPVNRLPEPIEWLTVSSVAARHASGGFRDTLQARGQLLINRTPRSGWPFRSESAESFFFFFF